MLVCPNCHNRLEPDKARAAVCTCGQTYSRLPSGGLDFLCGDEFADFDLDPDDFQQHCLLEQEAAGVAARMQDFLIPLIHRYADFSGKESTNLTVLDCGCGNGLSVDILRDQGMEAWGIDAGGARHQQWCERSSGNYLLSANALKIPFVDKTFDVVLSSGLVEHIGIHEEEDNGYRSHRLSDCDRQRQQFICELVRVLKRDGFTLLDHPNGTFPADFWHGGTAGSIRWHRPFGDMLPRYSEIARYFRQADSSIQLRTVSPSRRLSFNKVGVHWYGRVFAPAMKAWLRLMEPRQLHFLTCSCLNPYLITVASRQQRQDDWIYP